MKYMIIKEKCCITKKYNSNDKIYDENDIDDT